MNQTMNGRQWAVLLLTATLFGSSFFFIKLAIGTIPPATLAAARAALAVPVALVLLRMTGGRLPPLGRAWFPLAVLGALTAAIPYAAIAWGQVHIESALAGILFGMVPVFTVLLAPLFSRDESFSVGRIVGVSVGLGGVVLIMGPSVLAGLGDQVFAAMVTVGAALSYALGGIYARRRKDLSPGVMVSGQLLCASVMLVPFSLILDAPWTLAPPVSALAAVAAVAVLSTALPAFLLFWLIQRAGAVNASLLAFFMPVVAVVLGTAMLGELLPWQAFAGLGLIMFGAACVTGRVPFLARTSA